ncbi:Protein CBG15225 [Caenorhabditis briggsae]|uniref:Major sperm protein n=1 Tax=Caenorhabditis briggsae TaxID=6238 RepID=A8XLM3_CAEBR|nr:Protein CBG15225 [Caenorhabditis briggsae]CAP33527.1 Protein CBG15225 [Caenorhabditis briggsae]
MIPLMSLIASATATVGVLTMCSSKDRQTVTESKSSRASSSTAGTKSHRSSRSGKSGKKSSKSKKDPKKGSQKESQKESSVEAAVAAIPGAGKRQSETKKTRSERSSKSSRRSSKSKKCKAVQCDPNKLKNQVRLFSLRSRKQKSSGSGSHSGEKALKAVPNSSNYKFPEGQSEFLTVNIKPSTLRATPNKLPFAPTGGVQTVVIPNSTKSRKAFKVKTSDNLLYRVNPVFGFVEPGQNVSIDVLRHNGVEKTDHLIVLTSDTTQEAQCAKAIFETDPARELTVVPLVAH